MLKARTTSVERSPLHFARFEFKYILSKQKRDEIEAHLLPFLEYDPFVKGRENQKYTVRSLYYDDAAYTAFHDKIDGLHTRSKFRIRTYGSDADESLPYFLEIKGRHNNLVFKHRTPIDFAGGSWTGLSGNALSHAIITHAEPSEVIDQFQGKFYRRRISPVALIDYRRRPYVSKYDSSFRITFDEQLTAYNTDSLFPDGRVQSRQLLPG